MTQKQKLWTTIGIIAIILMLITLIALTAVTLTKVNKKNNNDGAAAATTTKPTPTTESQDSCPVNPLVWQDMACCRRSCPKGWGKRPLLLVSMDGFRADYLLRNKTASIQQMIICGTHAPFMFPSYVSVTFPNHYAIVTGLYPESHGIISNEMYDPTIVNASNRYFDISEPSSHDPQWWLGEPFWNTAVKNDIVAGTYFWPGSDVRIQNMTPTYWYPYDGSVPFYQRVDKVVEWLLYPEETRPQFITLYFNEPDETGHNYGPYSREISNELIVIDSFINYLMTKLFQNDLLNCVDIIMVADHGMELTNQTTYMAAQNYFNISAKDFNVFSGPVGRVQVGESGLSPEYIFDSMVCQNNYSRVYYRKEMPRRLHYSLTDRIGDVVIDMDDSFMFMKYNDYKPGSLEVGDHGYDFKYNSMHALFVAYGPSFKKNFTATPFQNIELYNLYSDLLNIPLDKRAHTNGTLGVLDHILVTPKTRSRPVYQAPDVCPFQSSFTEQCGDCSFLVDSQCQNAFHSVLVEPLSVNSTICTATECDYSSIYYANLSMPAIVQAQITYASKMTLVNQTGCSTIDNTTSCDTVSDKLSVLKPLNASMYSLLDFDAATSTAATLWYAKVPMYDGFYQGVWKWTQDLAMNYTATYRNVILFAGPIFDYDYNGLADNLDIILKHAVNNTNITMPTHFYQIFLRCDGQFDQNGLCLGNPYTLSFILPHIPRPRNYCQTPESFLFKNTARIRDIELLTGLEFFTNWDFYTAIQLRTKINDAMWNR